ncbi:T9SS type A sorting domain-containing protein [uncultured Polaribacter sp.]|uniref:T9SS type A sorting domain-containing protein n=1 Tax=uncultured Polaribacter sp. TaxID=174711 RepID=UPI00261AC1AF|nr:T9SS type A sorting domain-containing protein [uncultured Polaribacter sp.]
MKSLKLLSLVAVITLFVVACQKETAFEKQQREFSNYLENHPFTKRKHLTAKQVKDLPKKDRPDLAFEQDFLKTVNPITKRLHKENLIEVASFSAKKRAQTNLGKTDDSNFNWESRGPKTVSGRVRAMLFDPNDTSNKRVFSGGVSGGIWKNDDITDPNSSWTLVYPEMSNFAISALAADPLNSPIIYAGTGEGWGNFDAVNGAGIWKSLDGGVTWNVLPSTQEFDYVFDMVVRNEGGSLGVIYAATGDDSSSANRGLFRSIDGGINWTRVSSEPVRDLDIAADNKIWFGSARGSIFSSSDGTNFTLSYTTSLSGRGRVAISTAPSNKDIVYALITSSNRLGEVVKTTDNGASWVSSETNNSGVIEPEDTGDSTVPNDDFTRGQAWYDLAIRVSNTDENEVFIGGINTFKTINGGGIWFKVSSWDLNVDSSVDFAHADIHNIIYRPNSDGILFSTDGGIFYSDKASLLPFADVEPRNLNFNVTQYYSGAIDPVNKNVFIGGAQDNGTTAFFETGISNTTELLGGDGGFSFIDQTAENGTDGLYFIASTQNNNYYLYPLGENGARDFVPLILNDNGSFINPADYDDENNILYSYNGTNSISRAKLLPDGEDQGSRRGFNGTTDNLENIGLLGGRDITHIRVSSYNKDERTVYFGTSVGNVVTLNATNDSFSNIRTPEITGAVSCIEIGASDDEILLTYSNFGVKSVWYTTDGGENWTDIEGNLPDIPVRWALFNPLNRKQAILATEAGVWKSDDITATPVVWEQASNNMGNVRVDMLQYRESDNLILAATHGRGMFTATFTAGTAAVEDVLSDKSAFTVYPTVSNGNFTLFAKNSLGKSNVVVFDIAGRQVHKQEVDFNVKEQQQISINANTGIYIVNIIDKTGKKASKKIVIE